MGELTENVHTFVVPNGEAYTFKTEWTYDSWNRVRTIKYPDGEVVTYGYNTGGQLYSVKGLKGTTQYNYIASMYYDKFGNRTRMNYGNKTYNTYEYYTDNNRLEKLKSYQYKDGENQIIQDINYIYDPVGNITNVTNDINNLVTEGSIGGGYSYNYTYDDLYRLESSSGAFSPYGASTPNTYALEMAYSASGNIENKTISAQRIINGSTSNLAYNSSYVYNDRPHTVTSQSGISSAASYTWDNNGNMKSKYKSRIREYRFMCWDEENRLTTFRKYQMLIPVISQFSSYFYDASGDRVWKLTGTETQLQLNAETLFSNVDFEKTLYVSPLLVMTESEYTKHYFIEGERICSKIGGGFGLLTAIQRPTGPALNFIEGTPTTVKTSLATMLSRNLECVDYTGNWTIDESLAPAHNINNTTESSRYFYHSDHLGSASMITNTNGLADQHIQYLPYGELFVSQKNSSFDSRYKFTAKELDNETNYTYFGARYYDSDGSFWLSVDPMASERSWVSPYSYCQNSPVMRVDPTGALDIIDGYTVDVNGNIERVDDTGGKDFDVIYNKDKYNSGLREYDNIGENDKGLIVEKDILNKKNVCTDIREDADPEQFFNPMTFYKFTSKETAESFYNFVTANSKVEWNKYIQHFGKHYVATNHLKSRVYVHMLYNSRIIKTKTSDLEHNHPSGNRNPSVADINGVKAFKKSSFYQNTTFRISTIGNEDLIYDENSRGISNDE